jgi:hypothetical protein
MTDDEAFCGTCGFMLEVVRPGSHQCNVCDYARLIEQRTIERCAGLHSALESGILPPNQTEFIAGYEQGIEDYYQSILSLKGVAE